MQVEMSWELSETRYARNEAVHTCIITFRLQDFALPHAFGSGLIAMEFCRRSLVGGIKSLNSSV
jgi:hypothetical protein